jgi:methylenetetrahydrofolate--tRNA-(uracil-5-)-methyltransferase
MTIHIVGGGLAGSEAAWQALRAGFPVVLHEMRPAKMTAAHKTGELAELVCSNSLKSLNPQSAPGLLKSELATLDSLVLKAAEQAKVPAGQALAVDRGVFSDAVTGALEAHPGFRRVDEEVVRIPDDDELSRRGEAWIVATGPLTSQAMADELGRLSGVPGRLYFYDAIAPVIAADSIDMTKAFRQSRYDVGEDAGDYLNLPLTKEQYEAFIDAVLAAEYMPLHGFEEARYFESCLPIEVMVERGRETLRFGPMKPVGLTDPTTGRRPWANLQLRLENKEATMYSMVGFQTKMKWPDQKRVFSMIPALEDAEFLRFGSVHRNTYLKSPELLADDLSFRAAPRVFLAGQITGVEGYSAAIGLLAARFAVAKLTGKSMALPPKASMIGALAHYVTQGGLGDFQPMNCNFGLLPPLDRMRRESKQEKKDRQCLAARSAFAEWLKSLEATAAPAASLDGSMTQAAASKTVAANP